VAHLGQHERLEGQPGRAKTTAPWTTPAVARESMAALPISAWLSIRNSSPKPGIGLSNMRLTTSKVESREVSPVPPLDTTTWAPLAIAPRIAASIAGGSSLTIVDPTSSWPAATSRSAISLPEVSSAAVFVSEIVNPKQRTRLGPRALCSAGGPWGFGPL
jgi:hypothetical protein